MRWFVIIACIALSAASTSAAEPINLTRSSPGWTYFYRPGANIIDHNADLRACLLTAATVYPLPSPGLLTNSSLGLAPDVLLNVVIDGVLSANKEATRLRSNAENCMVVRGWEIVRVPENEGAALAALAPAGLEERLTGWIGASQPHGEIIRRWNNDLASAKTVRTAMPGFSFSNTSLSLQALPVDVQFSKDTAAAKANAINAPSAPRDLLPAPHLSAEQIDSVRSDTAIVFFTLRGDLARRGYFSVVREGPDSETPAWIDRHPWQFGKTAGRPGNSAHDRLTIAVAVPPGRWRIAGFGITPGDTLTSLCLGAPFFDVSAGDIVYAGAFDFDEGVLHQDMSFDPEQIVPPEAPNSRSKLSPAKWRNGASSACQFYIYAFEFPNLRYAEGYHWGGAASAGASSQGTAPER
jgi:hypothetical protein